MNPGLVVKLRPAGPWRMGPDSGARNRVDAIYHSDSLYSAITFAMARLGSLEEWLDATARGNSVAPQEGPAPEVCFSSCFPFLDEIRFVIPPRTLWPPTSPALMSAHVRWKSARFVPIGLVQAILAGQKLDENQWSVDGGSQCLVPAGRPGPFRNGIRWNAAVDRLTGASERHSTACLEFRPGAGLWTVASFRDEAARRRWMEPVKAAFRVLADTGMGGERSRGWGRAETPEFSEGMLPDLILPVKSSDQAAKTPEPPAPVQEPPVAEPQADETSTGGAVADEISPAKTLPADPPAPEAPPAETPGASSESNHAGLAPEPASADIEPDASAELRGAETVPMLALAAGPPPPALLGPPPPPAQPSPPASTEAASSPEPKPLPADPRQAHWLLSLFTPASNDTVDWGKGDYTVVVRGGRVESPAGSGELKKQLQMVAEGSVVYAGTAPYGAATDVAPDGFPHPVFRAGFAVTIPLPEVG